MNDKAFKARLQEIQSDRNSGSAELARRCLEIIAESSLWNDSESTTELLQKLDVRISQLVRSRPSMVIVANLFNIFQESIRNISHLPPAEARKKCADSASQTIKLSISSTAQTADNTAALIGRNKTVFTHSYSSTVLQSFALLAKKGLKVIISESRPLCEGYRLAEKLSQLNIPTTLITDAQSGLFVSKADMVLVGADAILQDFSFLNKAGTYLAALSAYDNKIPFYVCSEKYKQIRSEGETPKLEAMNHDELNAPDLPFVTIENIYFEITPAKLITGWINEDKVVKINPN